MTLGLILLILSMFFNISYIIKRNKAQSNKDWHKAQIDFYTGQFLSLAGAYLFVIIKNWM